MVQWNRGSEQLYGYPREFALGKRKNAMLNTRVPGGTFESLTATLVATGRWTAE